MNNRTIGLPPSAEECHEATGRALQLRLQEYRASTASTRLNDSAIQERLTGMPRPSSRQCRNGWWLVGTIVDQIAEKEFDVWIRFDPRQALATSERLRPAYVEQKSPVVVPDGIRVLDRSNWANEGMGADHEHNQTGRQ